ncbi:MAG TPA: two-component regulator propeller domain-containing protein, partial [Acidobacteriota bacterium]|nr:two-component regulator propeller domain-containing protein [Acidobacteriota bacterium]
MAHGNQDLFQSVTRGLAILFGLLIGAVWSSLTVLALDPHKAVSQYIHHAWRDELPQGSVLCITQTQDGYLWFGTYEGLVRFDGVRFVVFNKQNTPAIQSNRIVSVYEDHQRRLWIGTIGGGAVCYADGRFTSYTTREGLLNNTVRAFFQDRNETLWIGTDGGLTTWKDNRFSSFTTAQGLSSNLILTFLQDSTGKLWIGTQGGGINLFDGKQFRVFSTEAGLPDPSIRAMCELQDHSVWIATEKGLCRFANGCFSPVSSQPGLLSSFIWAVYQDRDQNIWVGTNGGGVSRAVNGVFSSYTETHGLSQNFVRCFFEDREGNLWIGTNNGLNRLQNGKFTPLTTTEGLSGNYVRSISQDPAGRIWIGTDGGGVNCLENGKVTRYTTADGLLSNLVKSVFPGRTGQVWIGTDRGLHCLENGKLRVYTRKEGLSYEVVHSILEDRAGRLWIGTDGGGLDVFENNIFTAYTTAQGLRSNSVRAVFEDRAGTLWIGTLNGLNRLSNGKIESFAGSPSLSSANVFSFYQDATGDLWIGTSDGLHRYRDGTFTRYTTRDGLFDDVAFHILEDRQGFFWISTNKGIYRIARRAFDDYDRKVIATLTCVAYGKPDGMQSSQCNGASQPAGWNMQDGSLWFPTTAGAIAISPDHIATNSLPPPMVIEQVVADGQILPVSAKLSVDPGRKYIEIHYTALSLVWPDRVRFQYQLIGYDPDWIDVGTRRVAFYTKVPPGEYRFRVRACNNDGVWNETGVTMVLHIKTPWWMTIWAVAFYAGAGIGCLYSLVQWRFRTIRRRAEQLELKVTERTNELAQTVEELQLAKSETERKNTELKVAKDQVEHKNRELDHKIQELIASQQRADRIFSALAEALPGTILDGKYRLDEKIGKGGFGAVFRAHHLTLDRPVAVKIFKPSPGNDSAEAVERFKLEGVSASRLNHPNAVNVLDSGISQEGIAYLVMELLEGCSLAEELRRHHRLSPKRCATISIQVCEALAEAHRLGIIHRDIKPENIFLTQTPEGEVVKVVDFGVAKLQETGSEQIDLTLTGRIVGTPKYIAPERFAGLSYDGRSDVYSLGVTMYEMLCGSPPFLPKGDNVWSLINAHLQEQPPAIRDRASYLTPDIEATVLQTLEKDPTRRPSASELIEFFKQDGWNLDWAKDTTAQSEVKPSPQTSSTAKTAELITQSLVMAINTTPTETLAVETLNNPGAED